MATGSLFILPLPVKRLAQHLGVGLDSIEVWMNGQRSPRLDFFLAVCMRLGEDPLAIAVTPSPVPAPRDRLPWFDTRPPWPPLRSSTSSRRQRRSRRGPDHLQRLGVAVRCLLEDPGSARLSATEAARSLRTSRIVLMTRFPAEYARIVASHHAYRAQVRDEVFALRRDDLRDAVSLFVSEGRYPSKQRVFESVGLSRTFQRVPQYAQVWREALREHGIEPALIFSALHPGSILLESGFRLGCGQYCCGDCGTGQYSCAAVVALGRVLLDCRPEFVCFEGGIRVEVQHRSQERRRYRPAAREKPRGHARAAGHSPPRRTAADSRPDTPSPGRPPRPGAPAPLTAPGRASASAPACARPLPPATRHRTRGPRRARRWR